jgi:tetratricopeptide (TPR) repeat protein
MKATELVSITALAMRFGMPVLTGSAMALGLCFGPVTARAQSFTQESEQLQFATELLQQADYQSAASSYEEFIRQFPRSSLLANAYVGAGDSHFFLKEPQKAMAYYREYESQFPNGKDKWLVLLREAQCLYIDGNAKDAAAKLSSIDTGSIQPPYRQTYYFYLGKAQMDSGNVKDAAQNFEKVIEQKSTGEYATMSFLQLASILERSGDSKDAAQLYNNALQSGDSMEIRSQIELMQAMSYMQSRQYEMAAMSLEKIADGYPTLPAGKDAAVNWFIALLKSNQSDEAVSEYNLRFKDKYDDPSYGPIHLLAVDAMLIQKQNDQALAILNALISAPATTQKTKDNAVLLKAKIMANNGQFDDALQLIDSNSSANKDTQDLVRQLKGQSYMGLGRYDEAMQAYSNNSSDKTTASCSQARVKLSQGQYAPSASLFMECFNQSKDEAYRQDALFSAFMMYAKANMINEAEKAFALYRTNYSTGTHLYEMSFNLADLYSKNKDYDKAVDVLKTVASSPSYQYQREALFQAAYNLQLAGKGQDALQLYGIVISQNTDQQLTLMSLKNSALIYSQNNDQDKAAETMDKIVLDFPANDLSTVDHLWLVEHWLQKKDPQRMRRVLAVVQKRPVTGDEALGIKFLTAEAFRLENNCSGAVPIYNDIVAAADNPYKERSRLSHDMCQNNSKPNVQSGKGPSGSGARKS